MKIFLVLLLSCNILMAQRIIPKPAHQEERSGNYQISQKTSLYFDDVQGVSDISSELQRLLKLSKGIDLPVVSSKSKNQIAYIKDNSLPTEGYTLEVNADGIKIEASTPVGFFYGTQSLLQLLPADIFKSELQPNLKLDVQGIFLKDQPKFGYRGVMLDVSRHFFSTSFVKKLIDVLSVYKINTFHWHLTDDQGWRIEIKKYPKLTEVGSIRKETMAGHYTEGRYDGTPYGGFYTQEEIKDVVAYAAKRYVNIIPEIEMPGHSLAALTAYPELGCTGGPYELRTRWGVEDHIYCPTEKTFAFLEDVLTEVMELFPSKYIHIGGDEAPKVTWENSKFCQDLIKKEGLKDMHELQSYFIKRIDKFVTSKGRRIIGWDEILEGGLSPNATVMSWRGEDGGIEAAKMKHDVIMTPNSHVYLDYYQGHPSTEPLGIGGYLPLERVYSYNPISPKLSKGEEKYILGVQGNLWSEYIPTSEHAEYMLFPRILAVAEIGWDGGEKNYSDFVKRLQKQTPRLEALGVNYSNSFLNVSFTTEKGSKGETLVAIYSPSELGQVRYTTNGKNPDAGSKIYNPASKVEVNGDVTIKAAVFSDSGKLLSKIGVKSFSLTKSTGLKYTLGSEPDKQREKGKLILTDGQYGDTSSQELWSGFYGKDFDFTLDLGQKTKVSTVSMAFLGDFKSWILTPNQVSVFVSKDGKKYKEVATESLGEMANMKVHTLPLSIRLKGKKIKYIKVLAKNPGVLPANHQAAGKPSWIFIDEVSVK